MKGSTVPRDFTTRHAPLPYRYSIASAELIGCKSDSCRMTVRNQWKVCHSTVRTVLLLYLTYLP